MFLFLPFFLHFYTAMEKANPLAVIHKNRPLKYLPALSILLPRPVGFSHKKHSIFRQKQISLCASAHKKSTSRRICS